jgi:TnpA family transposase
MAAELAQLPEITEPGTRKFLKELSVIQKRNKLSRILFYCRNGIIADGNIFLQLLGI